jgi:hypothetical protein
MPNTKEVSTKFGTIIINPVHPATPKVSTSKTMPIKSIDIILDIMSLYGLELAGTVCLVIATRDASTQAHTARAGQAQSAVNCSAPRSSSHLRCLLGAELGRAAVAEGLVRALGVVPADPGGDRPPGRGEVGEALEPHALLLEGAEEPLDEPVGLKCRLPLVPTVRDGSASRTPSTRCAASALSC